MAVSNSILNAFDSKFEEELGRFTLKVIWAKKINKIACAKQRLIGDFKLTPQEELFVKFFNATALEIKDMSDIDLQAYREELSLIALEARAKQTAVIEEDENRKRVRRGRKLTELEEKSLTTDETTTDAINAINRRNAKLSKMEKVRKSLIEMGMSEAEADATISARNISDSRRVSLSNDKDDRSLVKSNDDDKPKSPSSVFVNPFTKKGELK